MRTAIAISIPLLLIAAYGKPTEPEIQYANHIFNEIVSSARQFGSSLNHNGMAFFIAKVPADLEFYHGSGSRSQINGLDWLAFEPEHALVFARPGSNRVVPRKQNEGKQITKLHGQGLHHQETNFSQVSLGPTASGKGVNRS